MGVLRQEGGVSLGAPVLTVPPMSTHPEDRALRAHEGGGQHIHFEGSNVANTNDLSCKLGSIGPVSGEWLSPKRMQCTSVAHRVGRVPLVAGLRSQLPHDRSDTVEFAPGTEVSYIEPAEGGSRQGTTVTAFFGGIIGDLAARLSDLHREKPLLCRVGGQALSATRGPAEASLAQCALPPGQPGFVRVEVGEAGFPAGQNVFLYREPAQVRGAFPRAAWPGGGALVRVAGQGLVGSEAACRAAGPGAAAPATHRVSSALVVCETGAEEPGSAEVLVTVGSWEEPVSVSLSSPGAVSGVAPAQGPAGGGTALELQGAGVGDSKALHCSVGAVAPVAARWADAQTVECEAPAHAPGRAAVGLGVSGQLRARGPDFTYVEESGPLSSAALPTVLVASSWTPCSQSEGLPLGCKLLGPSCSLVCGVGTSVSFSELRLLDGDKPSVSEPMFQAINAELHRILPAASSVSGGMPVVVEGEHISAQDGCYFDFAGVQPMHFISSKVARCEVPSLDPTLSGQHSLRLANASAPSSLFLYDDPSVQLKMGSKLQFKGSYHGGTELQVLVSGVAEAMREDMACRFGTIAPVAAVRLSDQKMQCVSPAHLVGRVGISFGLDQWEYSPAIADFTYIPGISHGNGPSRVRSGWA